MQSNYRFSPQEDLTVMELAEILEISAISSDIFGKLPQRIQRHFTTQMTFEHVLDAKPQIDTLLSGEKTARVKRRK
jgi:hypothetical protein